MNEILLAGCNPTPLANYLKGLGIFRLLSEQKDPTIMAAWSGEQFRLWTRLSVDDITDFLLRDYRPTPILSPWNGGSGFFPNDNKDGFQPLSTTSATRFSRIAQAIADAAAVLRQLNLGEKPVAEMKAALLTALRNQASEPFLDWLDAAVVLAGGEPAYPPLLGTGGNDGRLDFSNNFLQRLTEVFDAGSGDPLPKASIWLNQALFSTPTPHLSQKAIGQFAPGAIGGANATSGFSTDSRINPWDFILMLEGAVLFASAASRRLGSAQQSVLASPFTVYPSSGGSGSVASADSSNSRGEMWMPLWTNPAPLSEVRMLLTDGRAALGRRLARNGLDFARAVSHIGIDRGITGFQRYSFMVRNGLAYLATPTSRIEPRREHSADLIDDLDRGHFLDTLSRHARGKDTPASFRAIVSQLESSLFDLAKPGAGRPAVERTLIIVGEIMQSIAGSRKGRDAITVIPSLSSAWILAADYHSTEFRIALALASLPGIATNVAPVEWDSAHHRWQWLADSRTHVWGPSDLARNLARIAQRRIMAAKRKDMVTEPFATQPELAARQTDIAAFLSGSTADARIAALLQAMIWTRLPEGLPGSDTGVADTGPTLPTTLPIAYRVIKPFFTPTALLRYLDRLPDDRLWSLPEALPDLLTGNHVQRALGLAWRRSRMAGAGWPAGHCPESGTCDGPRLLAALTIPLQPADLARQLPRVDRSTS